MPGGAFLFILVGFLAAAMVTWGSRNKRPSTAALIGVAGLLAVLFAGVIAWRLSGPGAPPDGSTRQATEAQPSPTPAPSLPPSPTPTATPLLADDGSSIPLWMASVAAPRPGGYSYQYRIALEPTLDPANSRHDYNLDGQPISLLRYPVLEGDKSPSMASGGQFLLFFYRGDLRQPGMMVAPWRGGDWGADVLRPANGAARRRETAWQSERALGMLRGRVVAQGSEPLRDARVQLHEAHPPWRFLRAVECESDGAFTIPFIPTGRVTLRARAVGYAESRPMRAQIWHGTPAAFQNVTLRPGGRISGQVVDTQGRPVAGAIVKSTRTNSPAYTTAEGFFMLDYLPGGIHDLIARSKGFAPGLLPNIEVKVGETTEGIHIVLYPGMQLSGQVLQTVAGRDEAVEGAEVVASYEIRATTPEGERKRRVESHALSGPDGAFDFDTLPTGAEIRLEARKGYARVQSEQPIDMNPNAPPAPITLRLPELADVIGKILSPYGDAVSDAAVAPQGVGSESANNLFVQDIRSEADGSFTIPGLPARSRFRIRAEADGYQPGEAENVVPADLLEDVEIRLGKSGIIAGHVLHQETEEPLVGISLQLWGRSNAATFSAAEGAFRFDNLPQGYYQIVSGPPPEAPRPEGEPTYVVVPGRGMRLSPGQALEDVKVLAGPGRRISGRVVLVGTEDPVPGVTVRVTTGRFYRGGGSNNQTTTDNEGRFSIDGVPATACQVSANKEGMTGTEKSTKRLDPEKQEEWEDVLLELQPEGEGVIQGYVLDATEVPVENARLFLTSTNRGSGNRRQFGRGSSMQTTDRTGSFRFDGLTVDATYRVIASLRSGRMNERAQSPEIRLTKADPATSITIHLGSGGAITGRVLDESGQPLEGARVTAQNANEAQNQNSQQMQRRRGGMRGRRPNASSASAKTNAQGEYRIEGLGAQEIKYTAGATKEGYLAGEHVEATGKAGEAELRMPDLVLKKGSALKGILVDLQGAGLGGWVVSRQGGPNVTTSYSGTFTLDGVPEKTDVQVSYREAGASLSFASQSEVPVTDKERVFVLPVGSGVRGRVVAEGDGEALANIRVSIEQRKDDVPEATGDPAMALVSARLSDRSTSEDGSFEIEHVPIGPAKLTISGGDLAPFPFRIEVEADWTDLGKIEVPRGVTLTGRLVDAATGAAWTSEGRVRLRGTAAVPGERVRLSVSEPDADSRIRMTRVPTATQSITLSSRAFVDIELTDLPQLKPGETQDIGDIPVSTGATLTGRIVDAESGEAIAIRSIPGRLAIWGNTATGKSEQMRYSDLGRRAEEGDDAVGRFQIDRVPSDLSEIYFVASNETVFHRISNPTTSAGGTTDLGDIPFSRGKRIVGRFVGPDGQPPQFNNIDSQFAVWALREGGGPIFSTTPESKLGNDYSSDGSFYINYVPNDVKELQFFTGGYLPTKHPVPEASSDNEIDLGVIALDKGRTFEAVVTDGDSPAKGSLLLAQPGAAALPFSAFSPSFQAILTRFLPANSYFQAAKIVTGGAPKDTPEPGSAYASGLYSGPVQVLYFPDSSDWQDPRYKPMTLTLNRESFEGLQLQIKDGQLVLKE